MAEVILFHHVQGLTRAWWPSPMSSAVIEDGMAHAREVGFGALLERGVSAAEGLSSGVVFADSSLPSYVQPAAALLVERVLRFLQSADSPTAET